VSTSFRATSDFPVSRLCPASFPDEKRVTIAVSGWLLDFMERNVGGDYDCTHSSPRVVNFHRMKKHVKPSSYFSFILRSDHMPDRQSRRAQHNPDIYLSTDVFKISEKWEDMRKFKQAKAKRNAKMALLYMGIMGLVCLKSKGITDWMEICRG